MRLIAERGWFQRSLNYSMLVMIRSLERCSQRNTFVMVTRQQHWIFCARTRSEATSALLQKTLELMSEQVSCPEVVEARVNCRLNSRPIFAGFAASMVRVFIGNVLVVRIGIRSTGQPANQLTRTYAKPNYRRA